MIVEATTTEREGALLLGWLRLLGWRLEIEYQDAQWRGIARRFDGYGRESTVDRCAVTHGELASELYHGALSGFALQAA